MTGCSVACLFCCGIERETGKKDGAGERGGKRDSGLMLLPWKPASPWRGAKQNRSRERPGATARILETHNQRFIYHLSTRLYFWDRSLLRDMKESKVFGGRFTEQRCPSGHWCLIDQLWHMQAMSHRCLRCQSTTPYSFPCFYSFNPNCIWLLHKLESCDCLNEPGLDGCPCSTVCPSVCALCQYECTLCFPTVVRTKSYHPPFLHAQSNVNLPCIPYVWNIIAHILYIIRCLTGLSELHISGYFCVCPLIITSLF